MHKTGKAAKMPLPHKTAKNASSSVKRIKHKTGIKNSASDRAAKGNDSSGDSGAMSDDREKGRAGSEAETGRVMSRMRFYACGSALR